VRVLSNAHALPELTGGGTGAVLCARIAARCISKFMDTPSYRTVLR
jgi:hypothetical protein